MDIEIFIYYSLDIHLQDFVVICSYLLKTPHCRLLLFHLAIDADSPVLAFPRDFPLPFDFVLDFVDFVDFVDLFLTLDFLPL